MKMPDTLDNIANSYEYPLLFATVSGAHLYGFPSVDSDYDLRGVHILPLSEIVGLDTGPETIEVNNMDDGLEIDLVTHDIKKFFSLMLKNNGYVLEQLYSPITVKSSNHHKELKSIANDCITKFHSKHYLGFANKQWQMFEESGRVKPLLYVYRVILTGINLMQTGKIEANLVNLNQEFNLSFIAELIERKTTAEKVKLENDSVEFHKTQFNKLMAKLEDAAERTSLPREPKARQALDALLRTIRIDGVQ